MKILQFFVEKYKQLQAWDESCRRLHLKHVEETQRLFEALHELVQKSRDAEQGGSSYRKPPAPENPQ